MAFFKEEEEEEEEHANFDLPGIISLSLSL